jgi:hypothetical protein
MNIRHLDVSPNRQDQTTAAHQTPKIALMMMTLQEFKLAPCPFFPAVDLQINLSESATAQARVRVASALFCHIQFNGEIVWNSESAS